MTVGDKIKQRRIDLNMTQDELAKKCGYKSRSSINKIECSRDLPLTKAREFAKALDLPVSYLMGWEDISWDNKTQEITVPDDYYIDEEAREMAEFMFNNPEYKVLFDASRKVKPEDLRKVAAMIQAYVGEDN